MHRIRLKYRKATSTNAASDPAPPSQSAVTSDRALLSASTMPREHASKQACSVVAM
jgi:hypothetical protein